MTVCCPDSGIIPAAVSTMNYQTHLYCQDGSRGIKRESVNVKQVMTDSDKRQKYPLSPSGAFFLHSLNHFNLPLNTIPSGLNFDHCHFANLQDRKGLDKSIIHPTHQFWSPLPPVMHFSHLLVTFVYCSVCFVARRP